MVAAGRVDRYLLLFALSVAVLPSWAAAAVPSTSPGDTDKVRLSISDGPDPVRFPEQVSTLTAVVSVRDAGELRTLSTGRRTADDSRYFVRVSWAIGTGARIQREVQLQPPFTYVQLPNRDGTEMLRFIQVTLELPWDGHLAGSADDLAAAGTYDYTVTAQVAGIRVERGRATEREIASTPPLPGTVTVVRYVPLVLTVSSPADGTLTRDGAVATAGTVSGAEPLAVSVAGAPVPLVSGEFSRSVALVEGINRIVVAARSGDGQEALRTLAVTKDAMAPVVSVQPPEGALLATAQPAITMSYADPSPSSGLTLASFEALLDGTTVTGASTVGTTEATYTPASPLAQGSHTLVARIRDAAGNVGEATSSFTVDSVSPVLSASPADGSTVTTAAPTIEASYSDAAPSSGLAAASFRAVVDGVDRTSSFTVEASRASYTPAAPLGAGQHTLAFTVADRAGNIASFSGTFTITLPPSGPSGVIVGQVFTGDDCKHQPLSGATVKLLHATGETMTDANGRFVIPASTGLAWLELVKPGYLPVQRYVRVLTNQEVALPVVYLIPQDSRVTHIVAAAGGVATDSTGNATLELPPGSLPADADIVLTIVNDRRASKGPPLRNFIPGAAVRILPEHTKLNRPARLRVRNVLGVPSHPIFSMDWNTETQVWERSISATVMPDGFFESYLDHFSGGAFT